MIGRLNTNLEEINNIKKNTGLGFIDKDKNRISILIPIVNYPTKKGKGIIYCSDTWKFEGIKLKKVK
ncbi:hypothetical protein LCGC14_3149790 [marine sediment metagenome]|uniref:Uncharacterized protein n=1 Tax=marine sediment metagenome TaxID=412755 RepID=A0A0F8WIG0_9ZZZZ